MYKPFMIREHLIEKPIIQGGMGVGVSLEGLASAVARQGGVGMISAAQIGFRDPDYIQDTKTANLRILKDSIQKAKTLSEGKGLIGVNIMVATRNYEEYVVAAVEAGADLVVCGAGLPVKLPKYTKDSSTAIAPIVSSAKAAQVVLHYWDKKFQTAADLVVIEGPKAGGHLGFQREQLDTITIEEFDAEVTAILKVIHSFEEKYHRKIPVVLAGGIFDRDDAKHAMSLGVDGIQVATRFVTTYECDASQAFKDCYLAAKEEDIRIIQSPVGMPGRAIYNDFLEEVSQAPQPIEHCFACIQTCNAKDTPYCITRALTRSVEGDVEHGLVFCGAQAYRCNKMETVQEVMEDLLAP